MLYKGKRRESAGSPAKVLTSRWGFHVDVIHQQGAGLGLFPNVDPKGNPPTPDLS